MAFMLGKHLVFPESFQYMASSLGRLADNLPTDKFNYSSQAFKGGETSSYEKEGRLPIRLMDSFQKFSDQQLPQKRNFIVFLQMRAGLSWDAMLKRKKMELMTDLDMFKFVEKRMRGGISYITNRYGEANNKYMKEHNSEKSSKYIH